MTTQPKSFLDFFVKAVEIDAVFENLLLYLKTDKIQL